MKTLILFLTTLCICFVFASVVEGQQQAKLPGQSTKTTDKKATIGERILDDREFFSSDFAKSVRSATPGTGRVVPSPCPKVAKVEEKHGKPDKVELETISVENGSTVMLAVHYYGDIGLGVANEMVMAVKKLTSAQAGAPENLTSALFKRILEERWTENQITAALGPGRPSNRPGVPRDMKEFVWKQGANSITIQFRDGKAQGGMSQLSDVPQPSTKTTTAERMLEDEDLFKIGFPILRSGLMDGLKRVRGSAQGWTALDDPKPSITAVAARYGLADRVTEFRKRKGIDRDSKAYWYGRLGLVVPNDSTEQRVHWLVVE